MLIREAHAGITVSDLERSIAFYRDVLEMKVVDREPIHSEWGERVNVPGAVIDCAMLEYGDGQGIELIQYLKPEPPNAYGAPVNAIGQVHIAFYIEDMAAKIKHLRTKGVIFYGSSDFENEVGGLPIEEKWVYFKDPDGTNLELIEYIY